MSYHTELEALAASIGSDGCTHALQVHQECCWEHDWAYVTGTTPRGVPTTKALADQRFRDCLQTHSRFRWLSPFAFVRWVAVHFFGHGNFAAPVGLVSVIGQAATLSALAEARERREAMLSGHSFLHRREFQ